MNSSITTSPNALSPTNGGVSMYNSIYPPLLVEESIPDYNDPANYQKKECFMKSPLTVYNHCHVKGVLQNAYFMRQELEVRAVALRLVTGIYIRPILLFVLKKQTLDKEEALKKIKQDFIDSGIPEEQLKIKTNQLDELQEMDLEAETCEVRYIITVSNLEKAWYCPFAYILASMEDRNLPQDLSTVLNCILPVPDVIGFHNKSFQKGYVLVASSKFYTVVNILQNHLHELGLPDEGIIIQNSMIELLKNLSIWEVLAKQNEDVKGIKFGEGKRDFRL
ncbi:MAG TPA: hypothetical protein VFF27_09970 [Bacteroidia bacterium]|jgi:type III restriction enzyme|nr:hypothetical protein [Bacteroidia bacterium]